MEVKDRIIRIGTINPSANEGESLIIDEYGLEGGETYHRKMVISKRIYETFQENPDDDMLLDEFLTAYDIDSKWKRDEVTMPTSNQEAKEMKNASRLFNDIDLETIQKETPEQNEQIKNKVYQKVYQKLSNRESLISNPLIMDVFNEAIREDYALSTWESVFPFFR